MLATGETAITGDVTISGTQLALFGSANRPVIVVKLSRDIDWLKHRQPVMDALTQFLLTCGIKQPRKFMRTSPNLRFGTEEAYMPHLTLGTAPRDTPIAAVKFTSIPIILGPTTIRGAIRQ